MAYVITRLCVDCKDTACADVCPVECIYEYTGDDKSGWANQLYINPDECIDCTNCEPACPWKAVFEEDEVPDVFTADTDLNYKIVDHMDDFEVATIRKGPAPTVDEIEENYKKYEYSPS
jgi:ferredoxin